MEISHLAHSPQLFPSLIAALTVIFFFLFPPPPGRPTPQHTFASQEAFLFQLQSSNEVTCLHDATLCACLASRKGSRGRAGVQKSNGATGRSQEASGG